MNSDLSIRKMCALEDELAVQKELVHELTQRSEDLEEAWDICNAIYMSRNISMNPEGVQKGLERIDALCRTKESFN